MTSNSAAGRWVSTENSGSRCGPQERLEVDPRRVGALGDGVVALVDDLVEDLETLVGQADLVGVGVDEQPGHLPGRVLGGDGAVLAPDVAGRFLHLGQEWFEPRPEAGHGNEEVYSLFAAR